MLMMLRKLQRHIVNQACVYVCLCDTVFFNAELINRPIELEAGSTVITLGWGFVQEPVAITVTARAVAPSSDNKFGLLTYTLDSNLDQESACIRGLESATVYEVCLQPTFSDSSAGTSSKSCNTVETAAVNDGTTDTMGCIAPTTTQPADRE